MGRPKYLNDRTEGRSNLPLEGLAEEERHPILTLARLQTTTPTGRPDQTPLLNYELRLQPEHTEPLLTALLQLAQLEPTGTN